mmetsp:Transcript_25641/g.73732  ORF Transcript_25641/g.73732 Transcript_25641/m.73732 type:complete len:211 (+) Transcript_25641:978-1610(+)
MLTRTALRSSASGTSRKAQLPASNPRATELPTHFCGTGERRHATERPARRLHISCKAISASSEGAQQGGPPEGSAGSWCTSMRCMTMSEAGMRWSMKRRAFFLVSLSANICKPATSISGSSEVKAGGAPSKPSTRKPSLCEVVRPSRRPCLKADTVPLPCQPASAVRSPIFTSSMRRHLQPSRRFLITSSFIGSTSPWALHSRTPAYSSM